MTISSKCDIIEISHKQFLYGREGPYYEKNQKTAIATAAKGLVGAAMALALRTSIDIHVDPYNVRFSINFNRGCIVPPEVGKTEKDGFDIPDQKPTA